MIMQIKIGGMQGSFLCATLFQLQSPYSGNNRTPCLRSCSKEGFKAVNISIANVSCGI